jgi:YidC/Oxa1 family membrane protein insertase
MDKRTLLAIVLSVIVITIGFTIQSILYPPVPADIPESTEGSGQSTSDGSSVSDSTGNTETRTQTSMSSEFISIGEDPSSTDLVNFSDGMVYEGIINPIGATLVSFKLLEHRDTDQPVDIIYQDGSESSGLQTRFGGWNGQEMDVPFHRQASSQAGVLIFHRDFAPADAPEKVFRIVKRYQFHPGEYMFELSVEIENIADPSQIPPLQQNGSSYSLLLTPQIGPRITTLGAANQRGTDYRRFMAYTGDKREEIKGAQPGSPKILDERYNWVAIDGKYFSLAMIPGNAEFSTVFSTDPALTGIQGNALALERAPLSGSKQIDTYRIYAGPKKPEVLKRYNLPQDNELGIRGLDLDVLVDGGMLSWLENILKEGLKLFYMIIPNWGIAIILLTILVKLLFYPLTKKSLESTRKMQELGPKLKEVQEKFKDNPQKMNQAQAEFYKKEGVNPLGGCLPILIQFPFFIAMYGLFNNHFDLRGALFIPGWITDLSSPDTVLQFGFNIPLLGNELHLLPFIYLASQLLYGKVTQNPGQTAGAGKQAKMMMYALPIVFFFVLYNVPAGLLVYWISQNIVTMVQQVWVNKHHRKKKA